MKNSLVLLCAMGFLFGLVGTASALLFTDTQTLGVTLAEGPIAGNFYPSSHTYFHNTPVGFEVPPYEVSSANLSISGYWIDGNDDQVVVEGSATGSLDVGSLNEGGSQVNFWVWSWDTPSVTSFNIAEIFLEWAFEESLGVTISANGNWGDGILELASSTFTLEYEYGGTDTAVPVAEPATMLLLGSGLIGLASFGRRKLFPKAIGAELTA